MRLIFTMYCRSIAVYAMVGALRNKIRADGEPFCRCVLSSKASLWIDKEQMKEAGGSNWAAILARVQKYSMMNTFFLSNA